MALTLQRNILTSLLIYKNSATMKREAAGYSETLVLIYKIYYSFILFCIIYIVSNYVAFIAVNISEGTGKIVI